MTAAADIRIGTAGWSIPRASSAHFEPEGTHLQRYARRFRCAEINSSFHRPHTAATYARWRDSTPADFRFAVKVPKAITHVLKLANCEEPFATFLAQTDGLGDTRGPLLVQLPPSLAFDAGVAVPFLALVRTRYAGPLVCEPRHASWFSPLADAALDEHAVARVAANPAPVPTAITPGGWPQLAYFRLHGSPRTYWSRYAISDIARLADTVMRASPARETWCVFDNTASGAAIENAWELREQLGGDAGLSSELDSSETPTPPSHD